MCRWGPGLAGGGGQTGQAVPEGNQHVFMNDWVLGVQEDRPHILGAGHLNRGQCHPQRLKTEEDTSFLIFLFFCFFQENKKTSLDLGVLSLGRPGAWCEGGDPSQGEVSPQRRVSLWGSRHAVLWGGQGAWREYWGKGGRRQGHGASCPRLC